jgi:hypothetical protein
VTADGTLAGCMRVEQGCFRVKEGRDGSKVYLHRLTDSPRSEVDLPQPPGPEAKRADPDTLHLAYAALLDRLTLAKAHREALHGRGMADDTIERGSYRTLPGQGRPRIVLDLQKRFGDKLLRAPGFVFKEGRSGRYLTLRGPAGLIIPCRDRGGRIVALKVRRDDVGEDSPRYCYISSAGHGGPGSGAPIHIPVGTPKTAELVRVTEGELKADIIQALTGLPTVSVPGVGSWRPALAVLKALGCKAVRLAFDADGWNNPTVARALSGCRDTLIKAGFSVELERWDLAEGKGLDDLLAAGKSPELLEGDAALQAISEIVAAASADEEPGPPDELTRLQDVLDAGGAEGLLRDKALMQALAELASTDPTGFAAVRASIRGSVSLRDLDKALQPFRKPMSPPEGNDTPTYFEENGCTYRNVLTREGPTRLPLCNFTARIVEELIHDDGAEQTRSLAIQGALADGSDLPQADVPAADFDAMRWVVPAWGTRAVVHAGIGTKDHLRAALQLLSGKVPSRTVFCHTGWRNVADSWIYLHGGGAIGPTGLVAGVMVSLPDPLSGFLLPDPSSGGKLAERIQASLRLLDLGPEQIMFPVLSAPYRAALGDTDFSLHLAGPTGNYKTELASLAQQHFGAGMDARHLPANWSSTGNSLEGIAFATKDALLVVDDFCPSGSAADVQRYHREADRLFRGQGNRAGRLRMRADSTLRPAKPPRGLVLSTGEDTPRGQSLRARLLVLEVSPGDIDLVRLTACQRDAAEGMYAASMAGFVCWIAPRYKEIRARLRQEQGALREQSKADGQHARTPGIVADLLLGLRYFLDFAETAGAITAQDRANLWDRGRRAIMQAGADQAAHVAMAEPTAQFRRFLSAAVASGRAHVASPAGQQPAERPEAWGWRREESATSGGADQCWRPQGRRIAWIEGDNLYLEPEAAFAEAQKLAVEEGDSLTVGAQTLRKRLNEKGLLLSRDVARQKLTVRRVLDGVRRDVLHLSAGSLFTQYHTGPTGPDHQESSENGPVSWAGTGAPNAQPAHKPAQKNGPENQQTGDLGRLGQSDMEDGSVGEDHSNQKADGWGNWQ